MRVSPPDGCSRWVLPMGAPDGCSQWLLPMGSPAAPGGGPLGAVRRVCGSRRVSVPVRGGFVVVFDILLPWGVSCCVYIYIYMQPWGVSFSYLTFYSREGVSCCIYIYRDIHIYMYMYEKSCQNCMSSCILVYICVY
jgi:hypothetical protein